MDPSNTKRSSVCEPRGAFRLNPRRGVALILTLFAVLIAVTLSASFLTAQSTTMGIARNIQNASKARFVAESGMELTLAYVRTAATWRSDQSQGVWVTDQPFTGGTFTVAAEDGRDANGDGVITTPAEGDANLADDPNDPCTVTVTGRMNGASHRVRALLEPVLGETTLIVYGDSGDTVPLYRTWMGSSWSGEQAAANVGGEPRWVVTAVCPTRSEVAVEVLDQFDDLNLQFLYGGSWSAVTELTSATGLVSERPFDAVYEQLSGDLLTAYRSSGGDQLRFRTYNGTTISGQANYTLPATGGIRWVRLAPKVSSNEVLLVTLDANNDVNSAIWNGLAFVSPVLLENDAIASGDEGITAAYETLSGTAIVCWTDSGVMSFQYRTWSGSAWSAAANGPTLGTDEPRWLRLVADPLSDKMILGSLDGNRDFYVVVWNGSAWGTPLFVEPNTSDSNSREFDLAFEKAGSEALAVWGRSGQNNFFYRAWNGTTWSAAQSGPGLSGSVKFVQMVSGPAANQVLLHVLNTNATGTLDSYLWNGSAFSALGTIETQVAGSNTQEAFMATQRHPAGSAGGSGYSYGVSWIE